MPLKKNKKRRILPKKKKRRPRARDSLIRRHWRAGLSVRGNYERMGVSANPNRMKRPDNSRGEDSGRIVRELELAAEQASGQAVYIDWHSKQLLSQLIEKHGRDYVAMAADIKLNMWQRTPGQLRRQCDRLRKAMS